MISVLCTEEKKKHNMEILKKFLLAATDCRKLTSCALVISNGAISDLTEL